MQNSSDKDSQDSFMQSKSESLNQQADELQPCLGTGIVYQDSASNQSPDQLPRSVSSEGNHRGRSLLSQSGNDDSYEKNNDEQMMSMLPPGIPEVAFLPPVLDNNPFVGRFPYTHNNQLYGCFLPAYAPYADVPSMMGTSPSSGIPLPPALTNQDFIYVNAKQAHAILRRREKRIKYEAQHKVVREEKVPSMMGTSPSSGIPLPPVQTDEDFIYVNAKQARAILRRREKRVKYEAQHKVIREEKPCLPDPRLVHANTRPRGADGRFLPMDDLQKEEQNSAEDCNNSSSSSSLTCFEKSNLSSSGDKALDNDQETHFGSTDGSKE